MELKNTLFDVAQFCNGYFMSTFFASDRKNMYRFMKNYSHLIEIIHGKQSRIFRLKAFYEGGNTSGGLASKTSVISNLLIASFLIDVESPAANQGLYLKVRGDLFFFDVGDSGIDVPKKGVIIVTLPELVWKWKGAGFDVVVPPRIQTRKSLSLIRAFMAQPSTANYQEDQQGGIRKTIEVNEVSINDYL